MFSSLQPVTGLEVLKLYKNEIGDAGNRAEKARFEARSWSNPLRIEAWA